MDRIRSIVLSALVLGSLPGHALADAERSSPVGTWRVIGDTSGEAEARVRITERNGVYEGRILTVFPRPGVSPDARCEACPGSRKGQPIAGLTILTGMRQKGDVYDGGEILDPDNGELYRCSMRVSADNRQLILRGYIGVPLFGRSQTWQRE